MAGTGFIVFGALAGALAGLWLAFLQWRTIFRVVRRWRNGKVVMKVQRLEKKALELYPASRAH